MVRMDELCGLRKRPGGLMDTPDSAVAHVSSACAVEMLPRLMCLLLVLGLRSSVKKVLLRRLKV